MSLTDNFEVYSNMHQVGNFDHYIPQLLLRRWRVAESGTDRGQIIRWLKNDNSIEKVPISNVAGEIDWDVSNSGGIPSDYINKKLYAELLEDKANIILKLINTSPNLDLTILEENTLSVFIAHQITRVPAFRVSLSRFFSIGISDGLIDYLDFGNKDVLRNKVAFNQVGMTYEHFLQATPKLRVEGGKPQILLLSLVIASDIAERIHRGNLHVLEIPTDNSDEFVLSDNPVVIIDFDRKETLRFVPWWEIGRKDFMILMPISRKKAVFYCNSKRKEGPVENNNSDLVELLNFGQYLCCSEVVLSQNQNIFERHFNLFGTELRNFGIIR